MTYIIPVIALCLGAFAMYGNVRLRRLHHEKERTWIKGLPEFGHGCVIPMKLDRSGTLIEMVVTDVGFNGAVITAKMQDKTSYIRQRTAGLN